MGIKVAKFGGSSVADAIQIRKLRDIVSADESIKYVVVSAPGKRYADDSKVTDLLYLCKTHIEPFTTGSWQWKRISASMWISKRN